MMLWQREIFFGFITFIVFLWKMGLEWTSNLAQIVALIGLVAIFFEIQKSRKELERQKEGLSMDINRVGTVTLFNKLLTPITITEIRQKRTFLKPSESPANSSDPNVRPEFTENENDARVPHNLGVFQDTDGSVNREFKKALFVKLKELRKQKSKKKGIKVSKEFLQVPVSWNDKCVLPDSLTHGLSVGSYLCVFVQTWIVYKVDHTKYSRYFVSWNSNLMHPTQEWNTYEKG